ncbi:hypothetical protein H8K01_07425 [Clostridium perfringens]|uniref:hypothetical protein n=1 Tax=Clostridium perfringens TaxID=1502 RepID=UPI0018E4C9FE|nr:hypothetical protein [Clostridium perfringens]MBI6029289.1 hypothetical protein [Clostridium perfringens]MBI6033645.1 hypothetical protein [Clostridium perfringens]MDK0667682.1 hypothetical protein [Clostridium perfringens]
MNFQKIQQLIKDIILRELRVEYEYDFSHMLEEEEKKHIEAIEKTKELFEIINSKLDDEGRRALIQLVDLKDVIAVQEGDYYFERGVRVGLTDLSYLNKYFNAF